MDNTSISQLFFIKFPIVFPLFYLTILYIFPSLEQILIILTILILAETHFGATWPLFLSKINFPYLKEKRIELIIIPILIIITSLLSFIFFKKTFLLVFFIANIYHVTRQSYGISKLYSKNSNELIFQTKIIYFTNSFLFFVAFFRFYLPIINSEHLITINIIFITSILVSSFYYIKNFKFNENYLLMITGSIIFYPACFVENPIHIILMGVTMHYTQYLYLTNFIYKSRVDNLNTSYNFKKKSLLNFFFVIICYSIIMTVLSLMGKANGSFIKELIFIPILGQMLHFYVDSQIWKFSEKHNRENSLKYLKNIIN